IETTTLGDIEATTGDVTMTAGDNIDIDATVDALAQNVTMSAGDNIDINAAVEAKLKVDMDATAGSIDTTLLGDITAGTAVEMTAGTSITTDGLINAGSYADMDAGTSIEINDTVTAGTYVDMLAGTDITINADVTAKDTVKLTATAGDITLNDTLKADESVTLSAEAGAILAGALGAGEYHVVSDKLIASSQSGIAGKGPSLQTDVNEASLSVSGEGDMKLVERDGIKIVSLTAADGSADIKATAGDIELDSVNTSEMVRLISEQGSVIKSNAGSLISADELYVEADKGIDLNTAVTAAVLENGTGDVLINELDSIEVRFVESESDVSITAGKDIMAGTITAKDKAIVLNSAAGSILELGEDAGMDITAASLSATATKGSIGTTKNAIELAVDSLTATAGKGINVSNAGDLSVNDVTAGDDVTMNVGGKLSSAAGTSITADKLTAATLDGMNISTKIASLAASSTGADADIKVTQTGAITLDEVTTKDGNITIDATGDMKLDVVTAADAAGASLVSLTSGGAITDVNDTATEEIMNVTADEIIMNAQTGIGVGNAIEISTAKLSVDSESGEIKLDSTGDLVLDSLPTDSGDVDIVVNDGSLTLNKDLGVSEGNDLSLKADDIIQNANLSATGGGNISLEATGSITALDGVTTTTDSGNISYSAGYVQLPDIKSTSGWLTVTGDVFTATTGALIEVPYVKFVCNGSDHKSAIEHMLHEDIYLSRAVWLNDRLIGGLLNMNNDFVRESTVFTTERHDLQYPLLYDTASYSHLHINDDAWENETFTPDYENSRWTFGQID
ncbi:MAG: hypothetical protein R3Y56_08315, partial [Akkermansia sp.]